MKTGKEITADFKAKVYTYGKAPVYTCEVVLPDGETIKGYGSTLESAEDTAWHGALITLRDSR